MGLNGAVWVCQNLFGCAKICLGVPKYVWVFQNWFVNTIISLGASKYVWVCQNLFGCAKSEAVSWPAAGNENL